MPNYILEKVNTEHLDFKVSLLLGKYKYKTFCFSASNLGGRIKHENKAGLCFESERWKVCS